MRGVFMYITNLSQKRNSGIVGWSHWFPSEWAKPDAIWRTGEQFRSLCFWLGIEGDDI